MESGSVGMKHDQGKIAWSDFPWESLECIVHTLGNYQIEAMADVLKYGEMKYLSADNWKLVSNARDRYFSAAMRHLIAWRKGEFVDSESTLLHLAHAVVSILFIMHFDRGGEA